MQLSRLSDLPWGLTPAEIMQVMSPFVQRRVEADDAEWRRLARKRWGGLAPPMGDESPGDPVPSNDLERTVAAVRRLLLSGRAAP